MKYLVAAALLVAVASPALAQTAPAPAPAAVAPVAPMAKFNLDTPIETIVADPAAKAALEKTLPGVSSHAAYESFKALSLRAVQPYSQGALTEEMLKKIEVDLAAVK